MSDIQLYNIGTPWSPVIQGQAGKPFSHQPGPKVKGILGNDIIDNSCKCKMSKGTTFYYKFQLVHKDKIPFSKTYSRTQPQSSYKDTMFQEYQSSSGYVWEGKGYVTDIDISRVLISANPFPEYNKSTQRRMRLSLPYNLTLSASNPGFISYPSEKNKCRYTLRDKKLWGNYTPYAQQCYPAGVYFQYVFNYQPVKYTTRLANAYQNGIQTDQELFKGQFHPQQVSDSSVLVTMVGYFNVTIRSDGTKYISDLVNPSYVIKQGYYDDQIIPVDGSQSHKVRLTRVFNRKSLNDSLVNSKFNKAVKQLDIPQFSRIRLGLYFGGVDSCVISNSDTVFLTKGAFSYTHPITVVGSSNSFSPFFSPQYDMYGFRAIVKKYNAGWEIPEDLQSQLPQFIPSICCFPLLALPSLPCNQPDPVPYTYKSRQYVSGSSNSITVNPPKFKIYKKKRMSWGYAQAGIYIQDTIKSYSYIQYNSFQSPIGNIVIGLYPYISQRVQYSSIQIINQSITDSQLLQSDIFKDIVSKGINSNAYSVTFGSLLDLTKAVSVLQGAEPWFPSDSHTNYRNYQFFKVTENIYQIVRESDSHSVSLAYTGRNIYPSQIVYITSATPYFWSNSQSSGLTVINGLANHFEKWIRCHMSPGFIEKQTWQTCGILPNALNPLQLDSKKQTAIDLYPAQFYNTEVIPDSCTVLPKYTFIPVFIYGTAYSSKKPQYQLCPEKGSPIWDYTPLNKTWKPRDIKNAITVSSPQEILQLGMGADGVWYAPAVQKYDEDIGYYWDFVNSSSTDIPFTKLEDTPYIIEGQSDSSRAKLIINQYDWKQRRYYELPPGRYFYAFKGYLPVCVLQDSTYFQFTSNNAPVKGDLRRAILNDRIRHNRKVRQLYVYLTYDLQYSIDEVPPGYSPCFQMVKNGYMFTNGYDKTCTKKNKNKNVLRWRQDKSLTDSNGIWLGQPGKNGKVTYQFIEPVSCHISENSSSFTGASLPKPGYKYSWDNQTPECADDQVYTRCSCEYMQLWTNGGNIAGKTTKWHEIRKAQYPFILADQEASGKFSAADTISDLKYPIAKAGELSAQQFKYYFDDYSMDHWGLKFPLEYYSKPWPSVYFSDFCVITAATITIDYSDSYYAYGDDWWSKRYTRTQEVITYTGNRAEGISTPVKDSQGKYYHYYYTCNDKAESCPPSQTTYQYKTNAGSISLGFSANKGTCQEQRLPIGFLSPHYCFASGNYCTSSVYLRDYDEKYRQLKIDLPKAYTPVTIPLDVDHTQTQSTAGSSTRRHTIIKGSITFMIDPLVGQQKA